MAAAGALGVLVVAAVVAAIRSRVDLATFLVGAFVVTLLLIPAQYTAGPFATPAATVVGLCSLMMWLVLKISPSAAVGRGRTRVGLALAAFAALVLVSYAAAHGRVLDAEEFQGADRSLALAAAMIGVALLASDGLRTRRSVELVCRSWVIGASAMAAIGIVQYFLDVDISVQLRPPGFDASAIVHFIYQRDGVRRVAGTARHPIEFGIALAASMPIVLHQLWSVATTRGRVLATAATGLVAIALPMALSRSSVTALAFGIAILAIGLRPALRTKLIGGSMAAVATFIVVAPELFRFIADLFSGGAGQASVLSREAANAVAFQLAGEHPWLGIGWGTFQPSSYFTLDNAYLVTLIETGVIGATVIAVLLAAAAREGLRSRRVSLTSREASLGLALVASLAAMTVAAWGLHVFAFHIVYGLLFLTIGLTGALGRLVDQEGSLDADRRALALLERQLVR